MTSPDQLCINTATFGWQRDLRDAIDAMSGAGVHAITPWRAQIQKEGVAVASRMLRDAGMRAVGLCRGGMFPANSQAGLQAAIDDTLRAVDEAAGIGAPNLTLVVGGLSPGSKDLAVAQEQVLNGIAAVLPYARQAGVALAIEPLHPMYAADRACVNSMTHANDLCDLLGDGVGIALDVYHVWWDPRLPAEIRRAGKDRLLAFHICDWLAPTEDLLLDRGMMGDGVIDIPTIRRMAEDIGYAGFHEVEIFSAKNWWTRDPREVVETCKERHRIAS